MHAAKPILQGRSFIYVLDLFPADTLNFIYNEIEALEAAGAEISIYSLLPARNTPAEAQRFLAPTVNIRPVSPGRLLSTWLFYSLRHPVKLLRLLFDVTSQTESFGKLGKSLGHLVIGVEFARRVRGRREPVHAHFAFKAATAALAASRLNGNPYSFTAHGSATIYEPEQFHLGPKARGATFIVAVSEFNREQLLAAFPDLDPGKVVVNRCGIRLEQFPLTDPDGPPAEPPRIVCVASLYPVKNHETLLRACALLVRRGYDFVVDLVGKDEGERRATLQGLADELGIAGRLCWHGVVDHGEVARLLREGTCCVLSSHSEGIPVSLMEAMALGVPVLGPRVTGVPELVIAEKTGLLADPGDAEAFAAQLARLLAEPDLRRRLAAAARDHIEARFDIAVNSQSLANIMLMHDSQ